MFLSDVIEGYLLVKSTHASPRTIKTDRTLLGQFLDWRGDCEINEVTANDVVQYLKYHEERGLSPYTVRRHYAILGSLYTWLTEDDVRLVDEHVVSQLPTPKLPKRKVETLSGEDIRALLKAAEQGRNPRRDKAMLLFLLETGARASEITGVRIPDVHFKSGKVRVVGKGDKERYVYLGRRALSAVHLYVKEERPTPDTVNGNYLFLTISGDPMDRHSIRSVFRRLSDISGVHAHPHLFRHTAATEHLRRGMNLITLQHLLGHSDISTTRVYLTALQDEDVETVAKRTSPVDGWQL